MNIEHPLQKMTIDKLAQAAELSNYNSESGRILHNKLISWFNLFI